METVSCCVMFNGDLRTEETGEVIGKANADQVARSYCHGNPCCSVSHSRQWFTKRAPRLAIERGWSKANAYKVGDQLRIAWLDGRSEDVEVLLVSGSWAYIQLTGLRVRHGETGVQFDWSSTVVAEVLEVA